MITWNFIDFKTHIFTIEWFRNNFISPHCLALLLVFIVRTKCDKTNRKLCTIMQMCNHQPSTRTRQRSSVQKSRFFSKFIFSHRFFGIYAQTLTSSDQKKIKFNFLVTPHIVTVFVRLLDFQVGIGRVCYALLNAKETVKEQEEEGEEKQSQRIQYFTRSRTNS